MTTLATFADFDRWLSHAVQDRTNRHQLWLGRPGKGKTARLHRHVRNTVGDDHFPDLNGRVDAPIYEGYVTPAKWFIRGWQHRLERLVCFNDVAIRKFDQAWEGLLCQYLERPGPRTVRWDVKSRFELTFPDREEITRYLKRHGLLEQFLKDQRGEGREVEHNGVAGRSDRSPFRDSLPELDVFESAYGNEDDPEPYAPVVKPPDEPLVLPSSYSTSSTIILIANTLGGEGWERIYSRVKVFMWDPLVDEQIADIATWKKPIPQVILDVITRCHARGEVLNLDFRAVQNAGDAFTLGEAWEDTLRASFATAGDQRVLEDAYDVLGWLVMKRAEPGQAFTERDLYQDVAGLRGNSNLARRTVALDYLVSQGWIERFKPATELRPGAKGRRPGSSFRVLRMPED